MEGLIGRFPCPYLGGTVELSSEREAHIAEHHPDLLPLYRDRIADTLAWPDRIVRSARFGNARLFSRWYDGDRGRHVVVVVVTNDQSPRRNWIVTAYFARRLADGDVEWARS